MVGALVGLQVEQRKLLGPPLASFTHFLWKVMEQSLQVTEVLAAGFQPLPHTGHF